MNFRIAAMEPRKEQAQAMSALRFHQPRMHVSRGVYSIQSAQRSVQMNKARDPGLARHSVDESVVLEDCMGTRASDRILSRLRCSDWNAC